jgi:hypothetical protein
MTTENTGTSVENTGATSETQAPQYTEIEQQAIEQGWRPKDEYAGEPGKWVSADIFVARAPLFEHISSQKKELSELRRALKEVVNTQGEIRKQEFANALAQLKAVSLIWMSVLSWLRMHRSRLLRTLKIRSKLRHRKYTLSLQHGTHKMRGITLTKQCGHGLMPKAVS